MFKANSIWRLTKRSGGVRFVVLGILLFCLPTVRAQWDSDPANLTVYGWPAGNSSSMRSDNLGGAFFFLASGPLHYYVGHVNADGFQTMASSGDWDHLQTFDPSNSSSWHLTLVPSEPPGTVIAMGFRIQDMFIPVGLEFVKYDTVGLTGFGRVMVADSNYRPDFYSVDFGGFNCIRSDGNGGLHVVITNWEHQDFYYNHLSSTGTWRYDWPGYMISHRGGGAH